MRSLKQQPALFLFIFCSSVELVCLCLLCAGLRRVLVTTAVVATDVPLLTFLKPRTKNLSYFIFEPTLFFFFVFFCIVSLAHCKRQSTNYSQTQTHTHKHTLSHTQVFAILHISLTQFCNTFQHGTLQIKATCRMLSTRWVDMPREGNVHASYLHGEPQNLL